MIARAPFVTDSRTQQAFTFAPNKFPKSYQGLISDCRLTSLFQI